MHVRTKNVDNLKINNNCYGAYILSNQINEIGDIFFKLIWPFRNKGVWSIITWFQLESYIFDPVIILFWKLHTFSFHLIYGWFSLREPISCPSTLEFFCSDGNRFWRFQIPVSKSSTNRAQIKSLKWPLNIHLFTQCIGLGIYAQGGQNGLS